MVPVEPYQWRLQCAKLTVDCCPSNTVHTPTAGVRVNTHKVAFCFIAQQKKKVMLLRLKSFFSLFLCVLRQLVWRAWQFKNFHIKWMNWNIQGNSCSSWRNIFSCVKSFLPHFDESFHELLTFNVWIFKDAFYEGIGSFCVPNSITVTG